jgi:hypothetical protein
LKRALTIGLVVVILAIGAVGTAFATGMTNSGGTIGLLSEGNFNISQINLTKVAWADAPYNGGVWEQWVNLYFDQTITSDASIFVTIRDGGGATIYSAEAIGCWNNIIAGQPVKFFITGGGLWATSGSRVLPDENGTATTNLSPSYYLWHAASVLWEGIPASSIYSIDVEVQD